MPRRFWGLLLSGAATTAVPVGMAIPLATPELKLVDIVGVEEEGVEGWLMEVVVVGVGVGVGVEEGEEEVLGDGVHVVVGVEEVDDDQVVVSGAGVQDVEVVVSGAGVQLLVVVVGLLPSLNHQLP
jgi:hypothetical protein